MWTFDPNTGKKIWVNQGFDSTQQQNIPQPTIKPPALDSRYQHTPGGTQQVEAPPSQKVGQQGTQVDSRTAMQNYLGMGGVKPAITSQEEQRKEMFKNLADKGGVFASQFGFGAVATQQSQEALKQQEQQGGYEIQYKPESVKGLEELSSYNTEQYKTQQEAKAKEEEEARRQEYLTGILSGEVQRQEAAKVGVDPYQQMLQELAQRKQIEASASSAEGARRLGVLSKLARYKDVGLYGDEKRAMEQLGIAGDDEESILEEAQRQAQSRMESIRSELQQILEEEYAQQVPSNIEQEAQAIAQRQQGLYNLQDVEQLYSLPGEAEGDFEKIQARKQFLEQYTNEQLPTQLAEAEKLQTQILTGAEQAKAQYEAEKVRPIEQYYDNQIGGSYQDFYNVSAPLVMNTSFRSSFTSLDGAKKFLDNLPAAYLQVALSAQRIPGYANSAQHSNDLALLSHAGNLSNKIKLFQDTKNKEVTQAQEVAQAEYDTYNEGGMTPAMIAEKYGTLSKQQVDLPELLSSIGSQYDEQSGYLNELAAAKEGLAQGTLGGYEKISEEDKLLRQQALQELLKKLQYEGV